MRRGGHRGDSIFSAVKNGDLNLATTILSNITVDLNSPSPSGRTLMMFACLSGNLKMAQLLYEAGEQKRHINGHLKLDVTNREGCTALTCAANEGHCRLVAFLVEKGAAIEHCSHFGSTPLMHACFNGHYPVVAYLLSEGANAAAISNDGWNSLLHAANGGFADIVNLILSKNVDINSQSYKGWTALTCAANRGRADVVFTLLEKGADPNIRNIDGCTALHIAACSGHAECCSLLLAHGADIHAMDNDGRSALVIASKKDRTDVVALLQRHLASAQPSQVQISLNPLQKANAAEADRIAAEQAARNDNKLDLIRKLTQKREQKTKTTTSGTRPSEGRVITVESDLASLPVRMEESLFSVFGQCLSACRVETCQIDTTV